MMNFIAIKAGIVAILVAAAAGQYEVVGAQRQREGSQDINQKKKVAVYFLDDEFDVNSGSPNGDVQSDPTYQIELKVSEKGKINDVNDPASLESAEFIADTQLDLFFDLIYQILMDARNMDLGLTVGTISNRFIKTIKKGKISSDGETVVIVGTMNLTCRTAESVSGDVGVAGVGNKSTIEANEDEFAKTGIEVPTT